jgi:transposase
MDARFEKAKQIVADGKVRPGPGCYFVTASTGGDLYRVTLDGLFPTCTCEDWELRGGYCKHVLAARVFRAQEAGGPQPCDQPGPPVKRQTYRQQWPQYNAAQTNEKDHFQELLADLCAAVPEPPRKGGSKGGRPPAPLRDALFVCVFKVYSTFSARRFASDLREAHRRGHLGAELSCDIAWKYLRKPEVTPVLHELITRSSLPLRSVEHDFAVDSSGFGTSRFVRWYDEKYGVTRSKAEWVKAHLCCGVKTNVVTAVVIGDKNAADCPQLPGLTSRTVENFRVDEVSGDKAYLSADNLAAVHKLGGTAYVPFKTNSVLGNTPLWDRMFHYFNLHRDEFLAHYHKRSNVESTFSMVKRKFGDSLRSKTDTAMMNEALAKVVCHNLCCVIQEWYELGIDPRDWMPRRPDAPPDGLRIILRFPG